MPNVPSEIVQTITAALTSGNTGLAATLAGLLHIGSSQSGLDFKEKTMTTTWEQQNQQTAIPLVAAGWTIIPG